MAFDAECSSTAFRGAIRLARGTKANIDHLLSEQFTAPAQQIPSNSEKRSQIAVPQGEKQPAAIEVRWNFLFSDRGDDLIKTNTTGVG